VLLIRFDFMFKKSNKERAYLKIKKRKTKTWPDGILHAECSAL